MLSPLALTALLGLACDLPQPQPAPQPPTVLESSRCEPARDGFDVIAEQALLAEINALRARGGRCGALNFLPAPALRFDPALRCAARLHTADMHTRMYLGVLDPEGLGPGARLAQVGYHPSTFAENVGVAATDLDPDLDLDPASEAAASEAAAADITATWADTPANCWKLHARELTAIGIGAVVGDYTFKDMEPTPGVLFTATFVAP